MESTGFNSNAAKIDIINHKMEMDKGKFIPENPRAGYSYLLGKDLSQVQFNQFASVEVIATKGEALYDELTSYQGWNYNQEQGLGSEAVIYQDKGTRLGESSDPYNPQYYEVGAVANKDLSEEENQALVSKIMENKLDPTGSYGYFKEGESSGTMKLEYGISPFDWKTMRGMEDQIYSKDDPGRPRYVEHDFSANGSVTTHSGKEVKFNMSYNEQLDNGIGIIVLMPGETMDEYDQRARREIAEMSNSQSDYRSISFNFESSNTLTKNETDALNRLAQKMMEAAEDATHGKMTKQGYDLANKFRELEGLFASVELNAKYVGAGQNETKMEVKILDDTISTDLKLDQDEESGYEMNRFWDH